MKKFSLLFFTAFITGNNDRIKASKIFFLAFLFCCISNSGFAQVTVTPASGGTLICGPTPPCTLLGDITITEGNHADFGTGTDVLTIIPPTGWQFCVGTCPTFTVTAGGDITAVTGGGCSQTALTFNITSSGITNQDQLTISGVSVQPLTSSAAPGPITATVASGINGITLGVTDFGDLALNPGIIAGVTTICITDFTQLSDPNSGGVWTSVTTTVATIDPNSGVVSPVLPPLGSGGTTNIFYTIGGCAASTVVTINPNPSPIVGVHDICQNVCYPISDATTSGNSNFFTSTLVTVTNTGTFGQSGTATLCGVNAGAATVTYTLGTGCFTTATLTVNPIPGPIIDPSGSYNICAGNLEFLSDATAGGTWASTNSAIATITPNTGDLTAVSAGRDTIIYTVSATGCSIDTPITVNPVPLGISGPDSVCEFSTVQLSDATASGAWSSSNNSFATVTNGGLVTGVSPGVVTITYSLNTGCFVTYTVTVNPVPDPIGGPTSVCQTYQITLTETSPVVGGTWSSSNTLLATIDPSTGILTGVNAGATTSATVTVSYTYTTGCSASYQVVVNPLPAPIVGPSSVCQIQCVILSDATLGGSWFSSQPGFASATNIGTDPEGQICGIQVGVVNITYELVTGCFVTQTETINSLGPIVGPTTVCEGFQITLNDVAQPGTWSSSNSLAATIDQNTGVLTGVSAAAGTPPGVTVVTFSNFAGCTTTATITVNPQPSPIIGADSVCKGSTTDLSDMVAGGVWSSGNTFIATVQGGFGNVGHVTGVFPGFDIITYTMTNGGCSSSITMRVDPLPGPILGPLSVCQGSTVTLSDASPGGTWTSSNTTISPIDPNLGTVTGSSPGTDVITYTLPTGCLSNATFVVNPLNGITGPTVVCTGSTITLSNNTPGGAGAWSADNTGIATVDPSTGVVTGTNPGPASAVVTITYTMPTSCATTYTVLVNPLPNPITGPSAVCQGQFITLSDSYLGGTWSNTNTAIDSINTNTGVVGGVTAGVDHITYTLPTGCLITRSLTVNPLTPIVALVSDVCAGYQIFLSDATGPTGTWSSSNTNVATVGSAASNVTAVTGVTPGLDTISYTVIPTGCTITTTVLVNPVPAPITGMGPVCVNSYIILSDITDSNQVGTWSVGNTAVATIVDTMLTGASAGIASITYAINATGCFVTATVLVNPLPGAIAGPINVCIHDSAFYSDPDTLGVWSTNPTSVATITTITDSIGHLFAVDTGVVIITYTLPTTCQTTYSVTIRPLPIVRITQSDSGIICKGATDVLTADSSGPGVAPPYVPYVWSASTTLSCLSCQTTDATPTLTTTYTVTVTTQYGCQNTGSTTVHVDTALNHLGISGKDSICAGEYDTLMVTGGVDSIYFWRPPTGLNCTNCQVTIANPDTSVTYWAIAVDFLGCKDSTSFRVTINPLPDLVISQNPTIVCKRSTDTVTVSGAGPGGHYTWSPNVFISCDTCATVVLSDTSNITYEVHGTSIYGCSDSISVKVSVLDTNVNTISNDTLLCIGKSAQLLATSHSITGNTSYPTYVWSPAASLNNPYVFDPIATPNVTTVYTVVVTENVCFQKVEYVQVTVEPLPAITIVASPGTLVVAGTSVQLFASAPNVVVDSFAWTPANTLSCDTCFNPVATPTQATTYMVTAISNFGCIGTADITILLYCDNSQMFIPNSFTPNGDGVNDRFYVSGKGVTILTNFQVFNRWGELLFQATNININDPGAGWDGTYKGHVLEPDVFIYKVTGICELGEPFSYTGDVSLLR